MAYTKQTWVDNDASRPVNADRLSHIEDGIYNAHADLANEVTRATTAEQANSTSIAALPRGELAYAERTTNDTATNTSIASALSNKISGLVCTVTGAGRAVEIEFWNSGPYYSSANGYVGAVLIMDGVQISLATTMSPRTDGGQSFVMKARKVLTNGQSYTFEVGKYGNGSTSTYPAASDRPMYLAVTER